MSIHRSKLRPLGCAAAVGVLAASASLSPFAAHTPSAHALSRVHDDVPGLTLDASLIPAVQGALPVLSLSPQKAPVSFVNATLRRTVENPTSLRSLAKTQYFSKRRIRIVPSLLGAYSGTRLAALVNLKTGNAQVFPSLTKMAPLSPSDLRSASVVARSLLANSRFIGRDDTQTTLGTPFVVDGSTTDAAAASAPDATPTVMPTVPATVTATVPATTSLRAPAAGAARDTIRSTAAITRTIDPTLVHPIVPANAAVLSYVPLRRSVGGYPVYGRGSQAAIAVGAGGSVQGLVRTWELGHMTQISVSETRSQNEIADAISAQLSPMAKTSHVTLNSVGVAYYDGDGAYMQPVYRFTATIHYLQNTQGNTPGATGKAGDDDVVLGYVPIGKPLEAIPSLLDEPAVLPQDQPLAKTLTVPGLAGAAPQNAGPRAFPATHAAGGGSNPTVGRYVVRNDDAGWVNDANAFWNNISKSSAFSNKQYYWAIPQQFTSNAINRVNAVNIALTEAHGDWWYFTTYQNYGDGVNITSDIASSGYGAGSGGVLDYWILHSCEVIPAPVDTPYYDSSTDNSNAHWYDPWFKVFDGLHSVVGYRTIMYINDGVGGPFGDALQAGAPVVSAWFNAVGSSSAYNGNPYYGAHGGNKPMGRASTISVSGHENDTAYDTTPLGRPGQLHMFWINN